MLEYFNSAKTKFEEEGLEAYISEVTLNEAKVYIELEDYKNAKSLLEKTIVLSKKHNQTKILSSALINSGKVLQHIDKNNP